MNSFTPLGGKLKHDPLMMRKSPERKKRGGEGIGEQWEGATDGDPTFRWERVRILLVVSIGRRGVPSQRRSNTCVIEEG